jgi:ABC-type sugar transport system ATPase subunit
MTDTFIDIRGVTKTFAGVTALDDVSLTIARGECHALMGENGAGKSTLGKVLAGIHRPDGGEVRIGGVTRNFRSPHDARAAGIGMVHQELAFVPEMSVAENLCLGRTPRRFGAFTDVSAMRRLARTQLERIGVTDATIHPDQPMRSLSTAQEQMVQIASAIGSGADVLIFDEPTSSLSEREVRHLFTLVDQLKADGVTIIYVSHRLPEIFRLCDRVSVLRDGRYVGSRDVKDVSEDALVSMMVGRAVAAFRHEEHAGTEPGPCVLEVRALCSPGRFDGVSFDLRAGEILGLAGLVGAGRSEIARALFGLDPQATGEVKVDGQPLPLGSIAASKAAGLAMVPEDRKRQGLALMMSCKDNFSMAILDELSTGGFLKEHEERRLAGTYFERLRVKTPSIDTPAAALSGGNQQKVVMAKWLAACGDRGRVLIVDEPTRGVDVGAKAAIHELLAEIARQGIAVLMISSELPELLALSHRILVMREGQMVAELARDQANEEMLMKHMAGVAASPGAPSRANREAETNV